MYDPNYSYSSDAGAIAWTTWFVAIAVYVYFALVQYRIAQKVGLAGQAWWAFVPILNIFLMIKCAGRPLYWFVFMLVPVVNLVVTIMMWMDIAKAVGKPPVWGILTIVASFGILFGFGLAAFLALTSLRRGTARRRSR